MFNFFYKLILGDVTKLCYRNCLDYFAEGSSVLDVGIGNGLMLEKNHQLIKDKGLSITGLDVNENYIAHCRKLIQQFGLQDRVRVHHLPVEQFSPAEGEGFDYALFSMSFMLLPDQKQVLNRVETWLRPGGEIVFFQTMFQERSRLLDFLKPKLKYVTSVDFGEPVYEDDFFRQLDSTGLSVVRDRLLKTNWLGAQYRMIAAANSSKGYAQAGESG